MKKFLITILVIGAGLGGWWLLSSNGIYSLSGSGNGFTYGMPLRGKDISKKSNDAVAAAEKSLRQALTAGQSALGAGKDAVVNAPKKFVGRVLGAVDTAVNDVRDYFGVQSAPPPIGIDQGQGVGGGGAATEYSPLGQVVRKGEAITFVVSRGFFKKNHTDKISVSVAWGDGESDNKELSLPSENKFLSHAFQKTGEFKILFTLLAGGNKTQYEVMILVKE